MDDDTNIQKIDLDKVDWRGSREFFESLGEALDKLDDKDWQIINAVEESKNNTLKEVDFAKANLEIIDLESLNSLVEYSSKYLAINSDFYNKLIDFLNTNYPDWHTNLFGD